MTARVFLGLTGLLYLCLAAWCTVAPKATSAKVGFELRGASGLSEFVTVYGGLEFGLALLFLMPVVNKRWTQFSLLACLLIHASLVLFRSASLLLASGHAKFTLQLAAGEWLILVIALAVWFFTSVPSASD